jgi:hypothetical protein
MASASVCRICYEEGDLVAPCHCKGTVGFVHKKCLLQWSRKTGTMHSCSLCGSPYNFGLFRSCLLQLAQPGRCLLLTVGLHLLVSLFMPRSRIFFTLWRCLTLYDLTKLLFVCATPSAAFSWCSLRLLGPCHATLALCCSSVYTENILLPLSHHLADYFRGLAYH